MLHADLSETRREQMKKDDAAAKDFAILLQRELKQFEIKVTYGDSKSSEDFGSPTRRPGTLSSLSVHASDVGAPN